MRLIIFIFLYFLYSLSGSVMMIMANVIFTQPNGYHQNIEQLHDSVNVKNLDQNIIDGVNVLKQSMINESNTIYVISYNYDLNGLEIVIPIGCTLDFQGGSLKNGSIVFNNTKLIGNVSLMSLNSIYGLPSECEASWFNIKPSNKDNSILLNELINILPQKEVYTIKFESGIYNFESPIYIRSRINLIGKSFIHGSDYWINDNRDECVFLFNHEYYGIISDNNTTGVNTFKNITFRAGNDNSGGCNFISELGTSSYNYNLLFEHCNFNGFKHKFGIKISDSWRSNINTCHFIGCGGAIGIIKGSSGENNDIMVFQCTIEECCVGIYGSGLMRNINIIGGTIEGIRSRYYQTTFPEEINIPQTILKKLSIKSQSEIRTAILMTGSMIGIIEGVYFEANEGTDLLFSYESVVNIIGCTFNDTYLKANPIIDGFYNSLNIQGCIFYINKKREQTKFIINANANSLILLGNDTHGEYFKNFINKENISTYFIQDTNGKFSISDITTAEIDYITLKNIILSQGKDGFTAEYEGNLIGGFTRHSAYTNKIHQKEPIVGNYVGLYFADGINWNPLQMTSGNPYLCIFNGKKWTHLNGSTSGIEYGNTRPILSSEQIGYQYFDLKFKKPIWWTGNEWVDANGNPI